MGLIRDEKLRALRAKRMISMRVDDGMSMTEIAEKMGIHTATVRRNLTWAKKAGLFVEYEDQILQDVVPKAIEALKMALDDGDGELAIKVLSNTLWMANQKGATKPNGSSGPTEDAPSEDLAAYIAKIRAKAQEEEDTADGTVLTGTGDGASSGTDNGGFETEPRRLIEGATSGSEKAGIESVD